MGGYYDAGDNMKFGLPMAFTTTMLAWSVADFGKYMGSDLPHARAALRWGADYLLKAATSTPGTLYVQVGDPGQDHKCWERPEDMDTPRAVYAVTASTPGSDVAAETAAALAASAVAFRRADPGYAARLLRAAVRAVLRRDRRRNVPGLQLYKAHSDSYICSLVAGAGRQRVPGRAPGSTSRAGSSTGKATATCST